MRGTVECIENVRYYTQMLRNKCGIILPEIRVSFDLRGTVAGRAYPAQNKVSFNPILLDENPEHFIIQTVGHEVAHLGAFVKYGWGIKPHGSEWQRVMWGLSLPANRCHNYDTAVASGRRHNSLAREVV